MTVKEIAGKWHTVSRSGKVGKRAFKTKENAEAAQARGRTMAGTSEGGGMGGGISFLEAADPNTAEERKALGIPAKPTPKGEF